MNEFYFIDYDQQIINQKKFLCIYLLELTTKTIFKIYKPYKEETEENLRNFDLFEDITEKTCYVIKRTGKLSLDIKI